MKTEMTNDDYDHNELEKIRNCRFIFEAISNSELYNKITGDSFDAISDEIIHGYALKD